MASFLERIEHHLRRVQRIEAADVVDADKWPDLARHDATVVELFERIPPEDDTLLRPQLSGPDACPNPVNPLDVIGSGVLLAYAGQDDTGGPRLLDAEGNLLGDIGSDWAIGRIESCIESAGDAYAYCAGNDAEAGQLPRLTSLVEIPCP